MLILTRSKAQSIKIGDDITVTILGINRHQIRLGISAPKHISVHREEVYDRVNAEKQNHDETDNSGNR